MNYTIFDPVTGEIISTVSSASFDAVEPHLDGKTFIEGLFNSRTHYIEVNTNTPIEKSLDPSAGDIIYKWDHASKSWIQDSELMSMNARIKRHGFLSEIDAISPVRYASLSAEQQADVQTYRQALLDVPQQTGFPTELVWPTKPTWL
jgi:hypothetical protein